MGSKKIVVAGGTGQVGQFILNDLLKEDYSIYVLSKNEGKLDALKKQNPDIKTYKFNFSDYKNCLEVAEEIGECFAVITSLGGWSENESITKYPSEKFIEDFNGGVLSHFNLIKAFLPKSQKFIMVNGEAALEPLEGAGHVSILDAAQMMLGEVVVAEEKDAEFAQLVLCGSVAKKILLPQVITDAVRGLLASKINSNVVLIGDKTAKLA